jgi:hypothetical protein
MVGAVRFELTEGISHSRSPRTVKEILAEVYAQWRSQVERTEDEVSA